MPTKNAASSIADAFAEMDREDGSNGDGSSPAATDQANFAGSIADILAQPEGDDAPVDGPVVNLTLDGPSFASILSGPEPDQEEEPKAPEAQAPAPTNPALIPDYYLKHGEPGLKDPQSAVRAAALGGIAAVLETKDTVLSVKDYLFGEPEGGRDDSRPEFDAEVKEAKDEGIIDGLALGIGQFAVGMYGLGKFTAVAKALPWFGRGVQAIEGLKGGAAALETAKAATVGAVAFDPHEERLSNLIQDGPLANPLTGFLAADPTDTAAEGRMKAALESIGLDAALIGTLAAGAKVYRALRLGDADGAAKAAAEGEAEARKTFEEDPSPLHNVDGPDDPVEVGGVADEVEAPQAQAAAQGERDYSQPIGQNRDGEDVYEAANGVRQVRDADGFFVQEDGAVSVDAAGKPKIKRFDRKGTRWDVEPSEANPEAQDIPVTSVPNPTEAASQAGVDLRGTPTPSSTPTIQFSDADTLSVLDGMQRDSDAMSKHGGWYQAIENGHTFGKGEGVPYAKLNQEADLDDFMAHMADAAKTRIDTIKGGDILTDARVQQLVNQRAQLFNDDPASVLGMLNASGKMAGRMVADMEAGYLVTGRMLQDTYALAQRIKVGDFSEFGSKDGAINELKKRLSLASSTYAASRSITANAGRAVRRMRREYALNPEDIDKLRSMNGDQLVEIISATDGNPRSLAKAANPSWWDKTVDFGQFLLINNLVSGPKTQLINAVTNAYMIGARPMERILGAVPGVVRGEPVSRAILQEAVKQYTYTGTAFAEGFQMAKKAFLANDSILAPHRTELYRGNQGAAKQGLQWKPWTSTANILHNAFLVASVKAIGMPTRTLGFVDELVKQTVYRSKVMAKAHMEAAEKGTESGLRGAELDQFMKDYITDRLDQSFDDMGRGVDPDAIREANIATFQQDLAPDAKIGRIGQYATASWPALKLVLPFVKTPTNVIRYGWKMTPVLNLLQAEYRDMLKGAMGAEAQAQAMGQMTMGTLFMGTAAYLVSQGSITGGGPKDYKLRQELLATGWQPYSLVKQNEDGTKTYTPFGRYDPVAIPFGIIADLQDAIHGLGEDADEQDIQEKLGSAIGALTIGLAKQFTSKTYLLSVSQFMDAVEDPESRGKPVVGRTAANFVPLSAALRQLNPDPYLREARGVADTILNTIPGLSGRLPPRFDAWGEPIVTRKGLWSSDTDALVDREMQRLALENGAAILRVGPKPDSNVDLRDLTLSDGTNAYATYQRLSGQPKPGIVPLKTVVAKLIQTPAYQMAPDGDINTKGTKLNILSKPIAKYRNAALMRVKADPMARQAFLKERLRVRDAYREARRQKGAARPSIGEAFGQDIGSILGDRDGK